MGLFQNSVVNKHLNSLDTKTISNAYSLFKTYFLNPEIQLNIRNAKEEQFQEGFLRELFVKVFGYKLYPETNYNLTTEYKNVKDSKKADGAIIFNGIVKGVIELKGTNTTDLGKIEDQAFKYKNNQHECVYVITSNFEKIRFYIDNAIEHLEFNLFTLTEEEFKLLYLCLSYDTLSKDIPKKIKDDSNNQEDVITKKLYSDYSSFKKELYQNLVTLNPQIDALTLFRNSQKLLDRFLFLFFAEDRQLLPPNSVKLILNDWREIQERDEEVPLYNRFKKYFGYLNSGFKGKRYNVFAYNGGLFRPDEILDKLIIDDELLFKHTLKLSDYDFASEVDVNILGHIFENSLNELDELKAELEGHEVDKTKTKRKKDGVFYTPKYITKYIVDNTVGKLCNEKKSELQINEEDYFIDKKRQKKTIQFLNDKLTEYRNWLLQIKICDPACGSGAFLNQALDFLINEHRYVDELHAKLFSDGFEFGYYDNTILENNLFGVDLNEESVEIARLSLWLRTAKPNRKLNNLSNNIKCGNSLIDDVDVAGEKAFNWFLEFPQVFPHYKDKNKLEDYEKSKKIKNSDEIKYPYEIDYHSLDVFEDSSFSYKPKSKGFENHGFDVVIGNPPYGILIDKDLQNYYIEHFPLTKYKVNLYVLFIERMLQLFGKGMCSFIIPKSLLTNTYYKEIRRKLITDSEINEIFTITEKVFEDAEVGGSLLLKFTIKNTINPNNIISLFSADKIHDFINKTGFKENYVPQNYYLNVPNSEISVISKNSQSILLKLNSFKTIGDYYTLKNGLNPGNIKHILISDNKETEKHKPIIWGKDISKYNISWSGQFINYDDKINEIISLEDIKSKIGMNKQNRIDFALRTPDLFETVKIVIRKTGDSLIGSLDENNYYFDTLVHGIYKKDDNFDLKFLLTLINSKPATIFYRLLHDIKGKVFAKISLDNLSSFPIPNCTIEDRTNLSDKANIITATTNNLIEASQKFQRNIKREFELTELTTKLQNWYTLSYTEFICELEKKKIKLTLSKKAEWEEYFLQESAKALELKSKIEAKDKEIDQMVYKLYELTEEEIKIVEGN